jgi:short-subunit dehydrogenase
MQQPSHVLITGASSGIGAALARRYARPGRRLGLGGRDLQRLEAVAADCRARGATVATAAADVTDRAAMRTWVLAADDAAPLDLVVANAGISAGIRASEETEQRVREVLAVNLNGVLNTVFPAIERMRSRGRGQIALMSSLAGYRGFPDAPAYSASKAAVKALAEAWRGSLGQQGIRVSAICPGFVTTPMTQNNDFPMPFLMSAERAAGIVVRGLARDRARIAFPWPMTLGVWFISALPARWSDRLLRPRRQ